jgi:hypothetical protein
MRRFGEQADEMRTMRAGKSDRRRKPPFATVVVRHMNENRLHRGRERSCMDASPQARAQTFR